ncbi:hypothetical protein SD78_3884 [Bacillus badius]|nr:hypothetical protein SD78_3884 [Bacillus badius]
MGTILVLIVSGRNGLPPVPGKFGLLTMDIKPSERGETNEY